MTSPIGPLSPSMYVQLGLVLHGPAVRAKLTEVGTKLEVRAKQLAGDAEDQAEITLEEGTRPGDHSGTHVQRPYSRVSISTLFEFGGPNQTRMRVLGRAAAEL